MGTDKRKGMGFMSGEQDETVRKSQKKKTDWHGQSERERKRESTQEREMKTVSCP